jgi:hypothetical protein
MDACMRSPARADVLDVIQQFHAEHGRLPRRTEWKHATPDRPCARTIERRWGWRRMLAEAVGDDADGLVLWDEVIDDRTGHMLAALVQARDELGRWPIAKEWEWSGRKPSMRTFVRNRVATPCD